MISDTVTLYLVFALFLTLVSHAIDANLPLTWTCLDSELTNDTGVNTRTLQDLQKFLACGQVCKKVSFTNDEMSNLKAVIGSNIYTTRASLAFKHNKVLRQLLWGSESGESSEFGLGNPYHFFWAAKAS